MYFKGNSKINRILQSSKKLHSNFELGAKALDFLFNKRIIKVCETYLLEKSGEHISTEAIEKNFEQLLRMNTDQTGYESSVNECKLVDNFDFCLSASQQFVLGQIVMENLMTKKDFPIPCVVYFTYDAGELTMRFHKYRENEGLWVSEDLETYEEPVGYYFIDSSL